MSEWNGFGSLDLSGVDADSGSARLQPGTYRVKCTSAKVEAVEGTKNRKVVCEFVDADGHGDMRNIFNVVHTSEKAQEIGRKQLKGFLVAAGHPNPDQPGDITSLEGLECVVVVGMGKPWRDNEGNTRQNTEIKKWMSKDSPAPGPSGEAAAPASGGAARAAHQAQAPARQVDDEIPF